MITKRTDELKPGDLVRTGYGNQTIRSVEPTKVNPDWGDLEVTYVPRPELPGPRGAFANAGERWQVVEPSKLDLAVRRAQELADQWFNNEGITGKEITELMDLFRAAR